MGSPSTSEGSGPDEPVLDHRQRVWTIGDYSAVARYLRPAQLDRARRRAATEGVVLDLQEGDAEHLVFDDGSFDHVVSAFGVIFAPDHARALSELARVCSRGGTVAITSWAQGGWFQTWRARAAALVPPPPPGGPDAEAWTDPDEVTRRFVAAGLDVQLQVRSLWWTFASPEAAVDFYLVNSGPFIAFREAAMASGTGDRVRDELLAALGEMNEATDGTCRIPAPYLLAVGHRSPPPRATPSP